MKDKPIFYVMLFILIASLPFWFIQTNFILNVAILSLIFMCASIAWNIISGFGGQISFGHSMFFGFGAYTTGLLFSKLHLTPWVGMIVGGAIAACLAFFVGYLTFKLKGVYFTLATFSITLSFQILAVHFDSLTGGDVGFSIPLLGDAPAQFQFTNKIWFYYIALVMAAVFFYVSRAIYLSKIGLSLRAIKDDDGAARASGVKDFRTKMIALTVSAFLTGVTGGIYIQYTMFIDPASAFGSSTATQIVFLAIAGGLGNIWGPVIGAAILVPLQQLFTSISTSPTAAGLSQVIYALVIIAILLIDPKGIQSLIKKFFLFLYRSVGKKDRDDTSYALDTTVNK